MRELTLELMGHSPLPQLTWWQCIWPGKKAEHEHDCQQFLAAQELCRAGKREAAQEAFSAIEHPVAQYFAQLLRAERGAFATQELKAAALMDRALRALGRGYWLPARKAAAKAKRLAIWRFDYQKFWYIFSEVEQAAELRRLCHKTRIVLHSLGRRKYHRHGTRIFSDGVALALQLRQQGLLNSEDWELLKAALLHEISEWEAAHSRELNRYRPDEPGFDECHGALQALPTLRTRLEQEA